MIEKTTVSQHIAAAVKSAVSQKNYRSTARLCAQIKAMTGELRGYYTQANASTTHAPQDEWLCDNYYVLEKESKQSVKDIRKLAEKARPGELECLYAAVERVICSVMPPICDETVAVLLETLEKSRPVSERQFAFVPSAIKAAMIHMAWRACMETKDEEDIAYAIVGLSKLSGVDLESIIHQCSSVEKILLQDPAEVYGDMGEESRQQYRYLIALIAQRSRRTEGEVAQEMLEKAKASDDPTESHIGYPILHHPAVLGPRRRRGRRVLALQILLPALLAAAAGSLIGHWWVSFLCFLPFWEILRTPLTQFALSGMDVDFLPRMDLNRVEDKPKTVVLVSTLLPKGSEAPALVKRLEQLYFSNSDPDMYYGILADFKEWQFPTNEQDESQVAAARKVVEQLNARYQNRFMLFLRSRTFNKTQNRYSGWERKGGAITEFIRFLKGEKTSVHTFVGDTSVLPHIKYIVALDSDTSLLYESAQTLVSAAIHPLNRPVVDSRGVVVRGYGILAPKISTDLGSAKATPFSRVLSGCGGVTAYETRDKDFYQDLFGESIFAGKGLIDIDSFYQVLDSRFPENQILSHDILEGAYLRCAYVSDVEMTDTAPTSMDSWLSRLHRWLRGDWQNIKFLCRGYRAGGTRYDNPITGLSKFKLLDNLRRSLNCVAAFACIGAAVFLPYRAALFLTVTGVLAVCFSSLWAAAYSLSSGGFFTLSRKFFTRTLPHTFELIVQSFFFLVMLPAQFFLTLDAVIRSLWRTLVSHKKMLEWTTAAQGESGSRKFLPALKRFWWAELAGLLFLLSPHLFLQLLGAVFGLLLPLAYYSAKPTAEEGHILSSEGREQLISYNAAMWRYYEDYAGAENHYLPPDNIQQSPVYRVANRTSPTNIGLMMLATLAARDFDFIDTQGLYQRIRRSLTTVEQLKTWNGNLYNWYDTSTLETLKPEFVSSVDSGNFICCLVALKEGLREFIPEHREFAELVERVERLIDGCDLTPFYNKRLHLFSIGWDVDAEKLVDSHYDFLMSEARLTSYYAVARKVVGKKHWGRLNRTMSRCGSYAGPVSWTGTMFEYFMPHLLLPIYDGSLLGESLTYCLYCQKKRVKAGGIPWGISESAFYAFDNNLNYQYKAHGVQKTGVKRHLDKELVISPYSTFITIPFNPNSSMQNLTRLQELGVYGRYGFYEAVDFTDERVGDGSLAVIRSYMAHHIGMSMVSSVNALWEGKMQKRFMKDSFMKSAREFLQEKIAKSTVVYDDLKNPESRQAKAERPLFREERYAIHPKNPVCMLLTNGEMTDVLTDTGAGYLKFGGIDLTRRSTDLLRRAQGFVALVRTSSGTLSTTMSPFYDSSATYRVEQQEHSVTYFAQRKRLETGLRCMVHPTISCEQRQLVVKNTSGKRELAQVLFYLEPVLCQDRDYSAHPAYSKLFVSARYDPQAKTLTFKRRERDGGENMFLTVGFLQDMDYEFETKRENLMAAPGGVQDLLQFHKREFPSVDGGTPDACCALRFDLSVSAGGQQAVTLLICASRSQAEGTAAIISMREIGLLENRTAARSPFLGDSLQGRLGCAIMGQLLFQGGDGSNLADREENRLGQSGLWCTGISGDLPIALIEHPEDLDADTLNSYIRLHSGMRGVQVEFDLCLYWDTAEQRDALSKLVEKHEGLTVLGVRGGVFLLERGALAPETRTLLRAVARHIAARSVPEVSEPPPPYRPAEIRTLAPGPMPVAYPLKVEGGVFAEGRFYVDKSSPLPYSHVLASPAFGTLVSDRALGFTWAVNARENKLTPWTNDICTDNRGELLLLDDGEGLYDLVCGSRASFSHDDALYEGKNSRIASSVRVTVAAKGCAKYIDVTLRNLTGRDREVLCAYYLEPVLGVTRDTARYIRPQMAGREVLVLHNPYNTAVRCHAAVSAQTESLSPEREMLFMTDRTGFLSGDWSKREVSPENDPCAAVIVPLQLPAKKDVRIRYILGYGQSAASAAKMVRLSPAQKQEETASFVHLDTPDDALNQFINHFAPHQILHSRIWGRCAFYQCGGAYGFRDQLQDVSAYLLLEPAIAKRQILRCCSVQFLEGDVLHWWHDLPDSGGGLKGVRTKFSDDLLWLPFVTAEYVEKTGDIDILSLGVRYLEGEALGGAQEKYIAPRRSSKKEDVFRHCVRALERGHNLGENGLPLIGCGDWNDGFSSVGTGGKGTSVWLGLFLSLTLDRFAVLCDLRLEPELARTFRGQAAALRQAVDTCAWDGEWYVRAFYDSGMKLGSCENSECSIDLLPQTFAVLAGMPDRSRVNSGMRSAWEQLVDRDLRLVRLFKEPFQYSKQKPGYVKAYPEGIRENGGQYTHSAVWFALALLENGDWDKGWEILQMLNPADRTGFPELAERYRLEPYYMAADIATNPDAPGRGGWSMYTGAVSWYYRVVLENLLGLTVKGDRITFSPKLPGHWDKVAITAHIRGTRLQVELRRGGAPGLLCDGEPADSVPLNGGEHRVVVALPEASGA